jgi:hypothetical protein
MMASIGAAALALAATTGATQATHTFGTLDCGEAGVYQVEGIKPAGPPFDVPPPWSGIYLLEGTTQVFRAFANSHFGTRMAPADKAPVDLITCTLTSEGPMFADPWTLEGMLLP